MGLSQTLWVDTHEGRPAALSVALGCSVTQDPESAAGCQAMAQPAPVWVSPSVIRRRRFTCRRAVVQPVVVAGERRGSGLCGCLRVGQAMVRSTIGRW